MRALRYSRPSSEVFSQVKDAEEQLDLACQSLHAMEEDLDRYHGRETGRMDAMRLVMSTKLALAKDLCSVAMIKAQYGIIGNLWYNDKDQQH